MSEESEIKMAIAARICRCADIAGSFPALSERSGVPLRSLQGYGRGENEPKGSALIKIAASVGVRPGWLLDGDDDCTVASTHTETDKVEIPILDVEVSTGHGHQNGYEANRGSLAFQLQYLAGRGLPVKELRVVYAKGDSMEPEIQDGAAMLVNTADGRLDEGCIYVVRFGDNLFAKRVSRGIDGVTLISANKEYPPMEVKPGQLEDMHVLGRVVWSGREH